MRANACPGHRFLESVYFGGFGRGWAASIPLFRNSPIGVTRQTVKRCLRRAQELGIMAALDDIVDDVAVDAASGLFFDVHYRVMCRRPPFAFRRLVRRDRGWGFGLGFAASSRQCWGGTLRGAVTPALRPARAGRGESGAARRAPLDDRFTRGLPRPELIVVDGAPHGGRPRMRLEGLPPCRNRVPVA